MLTRGGTVRLQIHSTFEMVDFVQVVCDRIEPLNPAGALLGH